MFIYIIDTTNSGYISADIMEELLTTKGTAAFRSKELENFFVCAKDADSGNIYYEDYIALLMKTQTGIGVGAAAGKSSHK